VAAVVVVGEQLHDVVCEWAIPEAQLYQQIELAVVVEVVVRRERVPWKVLGALATVVQ
jgi:hypothetical protein